jgi:hypothetical protein
MINLLKKAQLLQFMILIIFYILSNNSKRNLDNDVDNENNKEILYKNTEYYIFLKTIVSYNEITRKYINFMKKNKPINLEINNNQLVNNNDYFYIFYNKYNIYVYFFKEKNSDYHNIYFNGLNSRNDLFFMINIAHKVLTNKFNFEQIENIIEKPGNLYYIKKNEVNKISSLDDCSLIESFNYIFYKYNIHNNILRKNINEKIKLKINGYSLGGVFSQVFSHTIINKHDNIYDIEVYNVETWFGGNKELFDKFVDKVNIKNIYHKNSILYFYNILCQSYFKSDYIIECEDNNLTDIIENSIVLFPFGIIKYINNNHLLSKIFK